MVRRPRTLVPPPIVAVIAVAPNRPGSGSKSSEVILASKLHFRVFAMTLALLHTEYRARRNAHDRPIAGLEGFGGAVAH